MIQNKKLFLLTTILSIIIFTVGTISFILYVDKSYSIIGFFFICNSILAGIIYSLLFSSLKKSAIIKKIYLISITFCIVILSLGVVLIFIY